MPRVADLPPGWRLFSAAQKIEHLIGLDRCYEVLSWGPVADLDPLRRSFQMQVIRVLLPIGVKALLDGTLGREAARERNRAAELDRISAALRAHTQRLRRQRLDRLTHPAASFGENRRTTGTGRIFEIGWIAACAWRAGAKADEVAALKRAKRELG
jgi:hypothetical protein